jgi:hypothetical protein
MFLVFLDKWKFCWLDLPRLLIVLLGNIGMLVLDLLGFMVIVSLYIRNRS